LDQRLKNLGIVRADIAARLAARFTGGTEPQPMRLSQIRARLLGRGIRLELQATVRGHPQLRLDAKPRRRAARNQRERRFILARELGETLPNLSQFQSPPTLPRGVGSREGREGGYGGRAHALRLKVGLNRSRRDPPSRRSLAGAPRRGA